MEKETLLHRLWRSKQLRDLSNLDARIQSRSWVVYLVLLAYGCLFAVLLVGKFNSIPAEVVTPAGDYAYVDEYMSVRQNWLNDFIARMKSDGVYTELATFYDHNGSYYLYLTALGAKYGLAAWQLFLLVQMLAGGILIAAYPSLTYKATGSIVCALLAPLWIRLFMTDILLLEKTDSYWALCWIVYFSIPILYALATQQWRPVQYVWLGILLIATGLSNLPRANAGIGVLAAAAIIVCVKLWPRKNPDGKRSPMNLLRLPVTICGILVAYSLFTSTVPDLYQLVTHQPPRIGSLGPWHSLYIGIGWEENPYGIEYRDGVAFEAADYVGAEAYGNSNNPIYNETIMRLYLRLIKNDPTYFIGSYARKLLACGKLAFVESKTVRNFVLWKSPRFFLLLLFGVASACLTASRQQRRALLQKALWLAGIWLILFGASLLPGLIAVPRWTYLNGAIGAFDALVYMAVMVLVSQVLRNVLANGSRGASNPVTVEPVARAMRQN